MPTKPKRKARSNKKSKTVKKGRSRSKRSSVSSQRNKLDPQLALTVSRLSKESQKVISKLSSGSLITPASSGSLIYPASSESPIPPASAGSVICPASISKLPLGFQTVCAQVSPEAQKRLRSKEELVAVLVDSVSKAKVEKAVKKWKGVSVKSVSSSTLSIRTPRFILKKLAAISSVRYVEASTRLLPHLNLAHDSANLHSSSGQRTVNQTGEGVLIGIVDTGIDTEHLAFQVNAKTRIVHYFDQTSDQRYDQFAIDDGQAIASPDVIGHGTHVAGIAAGNGNGSPQKRFAGVAPKADLAIVKTTFDSADIAEAVASLFDLAEERDQPCVVNLSLGGHYGPHDGSSVVERTIDDLCDRPGRLVVCSAGNEGNSNQHAGTVLSHSDTDPSRWVADFSLEPRIIENNLMGLLWVQVWTQHEDALKISLRGPNGESFQVLMNDDREFDREVFFVRAEHQTAAYSGDHVTTFGIFTIPQPQWLRGWSIIVEEDTANGGAQVGAVHAWILDSSMGKFTSGIQKSHLVGMPGTAFSAITVGSYASRKEWPSNQQNPIDLDAINVEDVSYFSSPGPTRDGHNKPEISGPGQWLVSALSKEASTEEVPAWTRLPGNKYAVMQGTSMSAPYVTGAMALLLEKNPDINWAEAKRRIIKSTAQDKFTTPCWNERWGYGKLDIEQLLNIEPL